MESFKFEDRGNRIFCVERALREVNDKKLLLDENLFIIEICKEYGVSTKKAKEYIVEAKSNIKNWMGEEWGK